MLPTQNQSSLALCFTEYQKGGDRYVIEERIMFLGRCATCFLSSLLFTARLCIITQTAPSDPTCCQIRTVCHELSGPEARSFSLLPTIESTLQRATESIKFIIFKTSHTNSALNQFNPFRAILLHPPGWLPSLFTVSKQKRAPRVSYDCLELRTSVCQNKRFFLEMHVLCSIPHPSPASFLLWSGTIVEA